MSRRSAKAPDSALQSAIAPRNFNVGLDERVRGLAGPPAYSSRKRRIEDLEDELACALARIRVSRAGAVPARDDVLTVSMKRRFATLNELIAAHNRYYPIEANLPVDVTTGCTIDRSGSWPHPVATWASLVARARTQEDGDGDGDGDGESDDPE